MISFVAFATHNDPKAATEFEVYALGLEAIAKKYGGRPHFGKMNYATSSDIEEVLRNSDLILTN